MNIPSNGTIKLLGWEKIRRYPRAMAWNLKGLGSYLKVRFKAHIQGLVGPHSQTKM